jgi:hypothetical protein
VPLAEGSILRRVVIDTCIGRALREECIWKELW